MLEGVVMHKDSLGNSGVLSKGDIQWMTAGSGIIHEEMPKQTEGKLAGFQLWVNLPRIHKLIEPRYQDIEASKVPIIRNENGIQIRVLAGRYKNTEGPVKEIIAEPDYLDVDIPPGNSFNHEISDGHTVFAYIFEGRGRFSPKSSEFIEQDNLIIYNRIGESVQVTTSTETGVRFLLISGKPINEPIAWAGPIVMNTEEELQIAFNEYRNGTFLKKENQIK
jgi:redox-sensitive bicupin YhaK (pirin superfamily)